MKAYLEKAKSLKTVTYSPLSKQSNSVHSVLEWIDEEDSNMERNSDGMSAHTWDPRYFSKNKYTDALTKAVSNRERPSYSILARKLNDEDLLKLTTMRNGRGTLVQPRQQYLIKNRNYKGKHFWV